MAQVTPTLPPSPTPTQPPKHFSYRSYEASIALNNIGVTLLQRGSYSLAMDSFKEGIQTMKNMFHPTDIKVETASMLTLAVEKSLHRAHQRSASTSTKPTVHIFLFEAYAHTTRSRRAIKALFDRALLPSFTCAPIRIQEAESESCIEERDYDTESSILLYNLGLCYFHSWQTTRDNPSLDIEDDASSLARGARNLFDLSLDIVANSRSDGKKGADLQEQFQVLLLTHALLCALERMSSLSPAFHQDVAGYVNRRDNVHEEIIRLLEKPDHHFCDPRRYLTLSILQHADNLVAQEFRRQFSHAAPSTTPNAPESMPVLPEAVSAVQNDVVPDAISAAAA